MSDVAGNTTSAGDTSEQVEKAAACDGAAGAGDRCEGEAASGEAPPQDLTFAEQVKKIAYAAAGAVNISPEDLKGFVSKMVEKGELAQQDGRRLVADLTDRLKKVVREPVATAREAAEQAEGALKTIAGRIGKREQDADAETQAAPAPTAPNAGIPERVNASVERVLAAMNIATASDVEQIGRQIEELNKKLDVIVDRFHLVESAS